MRKTRYFNFIHKAIKDPHNANSWYTWLASKTELGDVVLDDIVHTDMRESIIITSMSSAQKYAYDLEMTGDYDSYINYKDYIITTQTDKAGDEWLSTNDLYKSYTAYCVAHGYTKVSHSNFTTYIKKFIPTKNPKNKLSFNISKISISKHITMSPPPELESLDLNIPLQDEGIYDMLV